MASIPPPLPPRASQSFLLTRLLLAHRGRMVHEFDQTQDPRMNVSNSDGWCFGMAVHWLGFQKTNADFWAWHNTDGAAAAYRFVMARQSHITSIMSSANQADTLKGVHADYNALTVKAVSKYGLKPQSVHQHNDQFATAWKLASDMIMPPDSYALLSFFFQNSGHAMASVRDGDGIRFMDPNYGEVHFRKADDFREWLKEFFKLFGYTGLTGVLVERFV